MPQSPALATSISFWRSGIGPELSPWPAFDEDAVVPVTELSKQLGFAPAPPRACTSAPPSLSFPSLVDFRLRLASVAMVHLGMMDNRAATLWLSAHLKINESIGGRP